MKRYEQRSSPIASSDPCRQATVVGMYEVEPNDGSSYRHFYLASDITPLLSRLVEAETALLNAMMGNANAVAAYLNKFPEPYSGT